MAAGVPFDELTALGPYFAVAIHDPRSPSMSPWQPLSTLSGSPQALNDRIAAVRAALATAAGCQPEQIEFRVAASVTHLGVAARLISPPLGTAVVGGYPLQLDPAAARWQPVASGAFPLSLPVPHCLPAVNPDGADRLAEELARHLAAGPVGALTEMTAAMSVSPAVLWGNVASAVNGAASMIAAARPGLATRAQAISAALLRTAPALAGTSTGTPGRDFRRRSCCLIYRISSTPGAAFCADCIHLRTRPGHPQPEDRPLR